MTSQPEPGRLRLLIVEDDCIISAMLAEFLGDHHDVACAGDAPAALAALAGDRPDVVLLDYHLRGGGSRLVADRVRAARCPLLWMTGDPDAVTQIGERTDLVLTKPFHFHDMLAAIQLAYLQAAKPTAAASSPPLPGIPSD